MNSSTRRDKKSTSLTARELAIFSMLGALMFCSKIIMEALPNIHLLGMLTMTYTLVYPWKRADTAVYLYFLNGFAAGFATWWIPYLYIWTVLWAITMLLPKKLSKKWRSFYIRLYVRCTDWPLDALCPCTGALIRTKF